MAHLKLLLGTAIAVSVAGAATAQTNAAGTEIVRAQHIKQGDVSPEEYAALLAEADRVRAYQGAGAYTSVPQSTSTSGTIATDSNGYQIEIFDAPVTSTNFTSAANQYPLAKTYPLGTDFSSAEFSAQSTTTTYAAPTTYGTTTTYATPVAADTAFAASTPSVTYVSPATSYLSTATTAHYVSKGDTLYNIAKRNGVSVSELKTANGLSGNAISIGQSLTIPSQNHSVNVQSQVYQAPITTVQSGSTITGQSRPTLVRNVEPLPSGNNYAVLPKDTLYSISRRACVSVRDIQAVNGNLNPAQLQPGQRLTLPGGHCMR